MSTTKLSTDVLSEIHERLLRDLIYHSYNNKIAECYNNAAPFCVITDSGDKYLDYPLKVKNVISKIESGRRMYVEQNYPELIVSF
jgi:hypothetical protein